MSRAASPVPAASHRSSRRPLEGGGLLPLSWAVADGASSECGGKPPPSKEDAVCPSDKACLLPVVSIFIDRGEPGRSSPPARVLFHTGRNQLSANRQPDLRSAGGDLEGLAEGQGGL